MNLAPVMKLVERSSLDRAPMSRSFEAVRALAGKLGKTTVSEDFLVFIVNCILVPMINEAVERAVRGRRSASAIETSMRLARTIRWDCLAGADFIGLDMPRRSCRCCMRDCRTARTAPSLLAKYVEAGPGGTEEQPRILHTVTPPRPTR